MKQLFLSIVILFSFSGCRFDSIKSKLFSLFKDKNQTAPAPPPPVANTKPIPPKPINPKKLYTSKCAGCHGMWGGAKAMGVSKPLFNQKAVVLAQKLKAYKKNPAYGYTGRKKIMQYVAGGITNNEIEALANYIEKNFKKQ